MASPTVAAVNGGNNTVNSLEHTVNLPTGISAGDLLLVLFASDGYPTITFPEGWTELFHKTYTNRVELGAWYRVADGEEGATITVTISVLQMTAHTSYRITGYLSTPEVGTAVSSGTGDPNPPSLAPTWGAKDTLWIAVCANDYNWTVTEYPANYTDGRYDYADEIAGCGVGTARRELNAESEDPGAFTMSEGDEWVANTVAIQPAVVAVGRSFGFIIG